MPKIPGKSPLAQAIRYALGRMPKAWPFLENGHLELANNTTDCAVKPVAIGWKAGRLQVRRAAEKPWQSPSPSSSLPSATKSTRKPS
nr:IS66 family transposase [Ruegeria arenilitoris]